MIETWIARDKDNDLFLYNNKPSLSGTYFLPMYPEEQDCCLQIDSNSFKEVTFENSPKIINFKEVKQ